MGLVIKSKQGLNGAVNAAIPFAPATFQPTQKRSAAKPGALAWRKQKLTRYSQAFLTSSRQDYGTLDDREKIKGQLEQ